MCVSFFFHLFTLTDESDIALAIYQAPDVRPIITAYAGKDIPLEYAKKEAEAKQKHLEEWEKKKQTPNPIGAMFGLTVCHFHFLSFYPIVKHYYFTEPCHTTDVS